MPRGITNSLSKLQKGRPHAKHVDVTFSVSVDMWKTGDYNYTTNALNQYIASNGQELTYDFDGNMLTRDGWTQTWDSENRIIQTVKGNTKLEFSYDYMGRRIEKKVFENNILISHYRFVYDNYKLVEELDALNESKCPAFR